DCVVSYADILFRQSAAQQLLREQGDVVIAVDSHWRTRYSGRRQADLERCEKACLAGNSVTRLGSGIAVGLAAAEFIGLVRFSARAVAVLRSFARVADDAAEFLRQANLSDVIELLRIQGM